VLRSANFPPTWRQCHFSCENHSRCVCVRRRAQSKKFVGGTMAHANDLWYQARAGEASRQERNKWLLSGAGNQDGATMLRRLMWMGVSLSKRCCSLPPCVWTRDKCPACDVTDNSRLDNNPLCRRGTAEPRRRRRRHRHCARAKLIKSRAPSWFSSWWTLCVRVCGRRVLVLADSIYILRRPHQLIRRNSDSHLSWCFL